MWIQSARPTRTTSRAWQPAIAFVDEISPCPAGATTLRSPKRIMRVCFFTIFVTLTSLAFADEAGDAVKAQQDQQKSVLQEYSDARITFHVPKESTVKHIPEEQTYLVILKKTELLYLRMRGAGEPETYAKQRTEFSRAATLAALGKTIKDGDDVLTVKEVSEVKKHAVDKDIVYLFTFFADATTEGESGGAYTTLGFGTIQGQSLWFQHTGSAKGDHPQAVVRFLETIKWQNNHAQSPQGEQPGTGQPATRPVDEPEGGDKPQPEAEGRSR